MALSWPWHFVSLAQDEIQHRRDLLDLRGYCAQCSALLAIMAIRVYNNASTHARYPKHGQRPWWDSPPFQGWAETRKQYLVSFAWLGWLLALSAWNTGNDYLHLTKSLGHVALSQLPFQVLMAPAAYITSRPASSSLLSALTCIPQPSLTPYHRLFGRVVIGPLLLGHASLYLSFFAQSAHPEYPSLLAKRINDPDVQWGFGALTMAVSVLLFARPSGPGAWRFRGTGTLRSDRQVFYVVHLLLIGCFCSAAYCHVAQARTFVVQGLTGFVVNVGCSWILMGKRDSR